MGVLNITPDSFSDGGCYNNHENFVEQWQELEKGRVEFIDIGAESTAPFNQAVSFEDEKRRYDEIVLPNLFKLDFENIAISIDTYKSDIFNYLYNAIKKHDASARIIWNDVSGVLDDQLFETLNRCPDVDYVFCHTGVSVRSETPAHMENSVAVARDLLLASMVEYFESGLEMFAKFGLSERVILDPCFGFSKETDLNHKLISNLDQLIKRFSTTQRWLIGISRKSFLKVLTDGELEEQQRIQAEYLQAGIIAQWMRVLQDYQITFRVHDPIVFRMALQVGQLFDPAHR